MLFTLILSTCLTAVTLASPTPETEVVQIREVDLSPRQDSTIALPSIPSVPSACLPDPSILSIEQSIPTAPPALGSALLSVTDYCHAASFTGSIGAIYSSYTNAIQSWYSQNGSKVMSYNSYIMTACPLYASAASAASAAKGSFTLGSSPSNTAALLSLASCGASATNKGSGSATGSAAKTTGGSASAAGSTGAAAPMQTGLKAAAGFVAGLAGVVAVL